MGLIMKAPSRAVHVAKKSDAAQEVLDRLEEFLKDNVAKPVKWLLSLWEDQAAAVSLGQARNIVEEDRSSGSAPPAGNRNVPDTLYPDELQGFLYPEREGDSEESLYSDWQHDYTVLADDKMSGIWQAAFSFGVMSMLAGMEGAGTGRNSGAVNPSTFPGWQGGATDTVSPAGRQGASSGQEEPGRSTGGSGWNPGSGRNSTQIPSGDTRSLLDPAPLPGSRGGQGGSGSRGGLGSSGSRGDQTIIYNPTEEAVRNWISNRSGELITNSTNEQIEAIRHILAESQANHMSVDETARLIRPTIGLTRPQAAANLKYYQSVKEQLQKDHPRMKPESVERKARAATEKYAEKQRKYRAKLIAETELASAYNHGVHEAVREGMSSGRLPLMKEIWSTAKNGRVCEACQDLEGVEVGFDEEFSVDIHSKRNPERVLRTLATTVPPLHPRCHCALQYVEVISSTRDNNPTEFFNLGSRESGSNSTSEDGYTHEVLGEIEYSRAEEALSYFNKQIYAEAIEHAIVIDKNGIVHHFYGDSISVIVSKVDLSGAFVTHNHPESNGIVSFGADDFYFLKENQKLALFQACNKDYVYSTRVLKSIDNIVYNTIYRSAMVSWKPEDEIQDLAMRLLSERGYIWYDKKRFE